jgi:hypothetical protein
LLSCREPPAACRQVLAAPDAKRQPADDGKADFIPHQTALRFSLAAP